MKPGDRIGAVASIDENIRFLGYGTCTGTAVPRGVPGLHAALLASAGTETTVFTLDSGDRVFAFECWYGPEEQIRSQLLGKPVCEISVSELRAQARRGCMDVD